MEGWTTGEQLAFLHDGIHASNDSGADILEIGSAWGRSTVVMARAAVPDRGLLSIDPHTGGVAFIRGGKSQSSYEAFCQNLEAAGVRTKVDVLRHTTREAIARELVSPDRLFSYVFVDGLHTAEGVRTDWELFWPRLSKEAVVVFHDYFQPTVADYGEEIDRLVASTPDLVLEKDPALGLVWFQNADRP